MNNAVLSIRTDDKTKREVANFAASLGLSVSAFATVVIKQAMREKRIVLTPDLKPTKYLENIIKKAEADYRIGKNITRVKDKAELEAYLQSL